LVSGTRSADGAHGISATFLAALDETAKITKADIFLLKPKQIDDAASLNGSIEMSGSEKLRLVVFGDMLTEEHAKIRLLILIDTLVRLEMSSQMSTGLLIVHSTISTLTICPSICLSIL
jgi:hypothetical protein